MTSTNSMTLRDKTMSKMDQAEHTDQPVTFEPLEAKLAGAFVENAITLEDVIDDYDEDSE